MSELKTRSRLAAALASVGAQAGKRVRGRIAARAMDLRVQLQAGQVDETQRQFVEGRVRGLEEALEEMG